MHPTTNRHVIPSLLAALALPLAARAQTTFFFSTNAPDGLMAAATHPEGGTLIDHETGDDFNLSAHTSLTDAAFTGLLPQGVPVSSIRRVIIEIYRVFPFDSDTARIIGVPTRNNSPADVAFEERSSDDGSIVFGAAIVSDTFTAANSVLTGLVPRGGGEGAVTGEEVQITARIARPINLPAGHYFFVPQVEVADGDGVVVPFLWLSAPKPIVAPGTPLTLDLQAWTRDADLDPDWLRIGADIVGPNPPNPAPAFNMSFSLRGSSNGACPCDWNDDGVLNSQDFFDFLSSLFTAPSADFNGDGITNAQDFFDFLGCFFAGCE